MDSKKIYIVISAVFGLAYADNLYWFVYMMSHYSQAVFHADYIIRMLVIFTGITGLAIFIFSNFKRSNLIRIMFCIEIISMPFWVLWYVQVFSSRQEQFLQIQKYIDWKMYFGLFLNTALFIASIIGLRKLSYNKVALLHYVEIGNEQIAQFSPAPAGLRFVNRLVDLAVIFFILYMHARTVQSLIPYSIDLNYPLIALIDIPLFIIYYLTLEGIFNTSAGKCATGTTITNESGQRPSFGQVATRTFCRLIPFEPFSFFNAGARGWHDSMSNTYVVESVNADDTKENETILDTAFSNIQL